MELELLKEAYKSYLEKFQKLVNYITAICVSALAFTAYITYGKNLNQIDIILAFAVICWMISIFSGLKIMELIIESESVTVRLLKDSLASQIAIQMKKLIIYKIELKMKIQRWTFYFGIIFYIAWHIVKMIKN